MIFKHQNHGFSCSQTMKQTKTPWPKGVVSGPPKRPICHRPRAEESYLTSVLSSNPVGDTQGAADLVKLDIPLLPSCLFFF